MPLVVFIDATSVCAAVAASCVKIPVDNGMLPHVQYLRALLDSRVITAICWTDMADGAKKGAVDNFAIKATFKNLKCNKKSCSIYLKRMVLHHDKKAPSIAAISSEHEKYHNKWGVFAVVMCKCNSAYECGSY